MYIVIIIKVRQFSCTGFWDTGKVRDRFGGMARLKSGLNYKG